MVPERSCRSRASCSDSWWRRFAASAAPTKRSSARPVLAHNNRWRRFSPRGPLRPWAHAVVAGRLQTPSERRSRRPLLRGLRGSVRRVSAPREAKASLGGASWLLFSRYATANRTGAGPQRAGERRQALI
jgi:hypothetical protein